jgi:hypothetical protein
MRPPKFESQDASSRWVLHKAHSPTAFLTKDLIHKLILLVLGFQARRQWLAWLQAINTTLLETVFFSRFCRNHQLNCRVVRGDPAC